MNTVKRFFYRHAASLTTLALAITLSAGAGQSCRTWFYQPKVPQK